MKHFFWLLLAISISTLAQHKQPDASEIRLKINKLQFLGSVLYMAAHPDDENTRVITYLSKDKLATTAYLSLTRGDGGQNLIGPELRDLLGVIRTQELLAARRIDGGSQFFTRAIDFGYSKSAAEAMQVWGKDEIMADVVKVFRQYQPDVIITRFPPDERAGHGHHTASAIFAQEAFDIAADAKKFPETANTFGPWQVKRLYTNTGRWWNKEINENTPGVITLDVGGYNSLLGESYTEISARSSSQHKSQGWGRRGERGESFEFLEYVKGDRASKDIFEGINTSWTRVEGGEKIQQLITQLQKTYSGENPAASVPQLLEIRSKISALKDGVWKERKLIEVETLIQDCLGLFIEATGTEYFGAPGFSTSGSIEMINRSETPVTITRIQAPALQWDTTLSPALSNNTRINIRFEKPISDAASYSDPYWLASPHDVGLFTVENKDMIGRPENQPAINFQIDTQINGNPIRIRVPLIYKWVDPVKGELSRPYEIVPPVFINPVQKSLIFTNDEPKQLSVQLTSAIDSVFEGVITLQMPEGWKATPATISFSLPSKGVEVNKNFSITPSTTASSGNIIVRAELKGKQFDKSLRLIEYDHIPTQTILPSAATHVVSVDLKTSGKLIAYIEGAGDEIPEALRDMGYEVWEMKNDEITLENLRKVDAAVLGIRALNTNARVKFFMADLLSWVKEGGTLVSQYNTSHALIINDFAPYSIKLGRDRVTQEDSEVRILNPQHAVLNTPNKITTNDFQGWVQERGLYFPGEWDKAFEPIISMNDSGEKPKDGSLLVARHGKGYFVYTGLSFFRQLPEGVPGAYRLFANIVSLGNETTASSKKIKNGTK